MSIVPKHLVAVLFPYGTCNSLKTARLWHGKVLEKQLILAKIPVSLCGDYADCCFSFCYFGGVRANDLEKFVEKSLCGHPPCCLYGYCWHSLCFSLLRHHSVNSVSSATRRVHTHYIYYFCVHEVHTSKTMVKTEILKTGGKILLHTLLFCV